MEEFFKRKLEDEIEKYTERKEIIGIRGARQTGKTTLLKIISDKIQADKAFINLDLIEYRRTLGENPIDFVKRFKKTGKLFMFLDEVQRVCSRIAILSKGKLKAYDTVRSLRRKLSKPAVEIALTHKREAEKALDLLKSLNCVSECERDGLKITAIAKGDKTSTILSELVKEGIMVKEVRNVTKSMEDVYLNVVNHSEGKL